MIGNCLQSLLAKLSEKERSKLDKLIQKYNTAVEEGNPIHHHLCMELIKAYQNIKLEHEKC
ncbi:MULTISPECIES: hypothetical protein [Bacillus]|uniref:Uncharacterized protein n=1 Tax=Bacillus cereus TaxID=1396 RepID=A0A150AXN4_BACCE|nr:MULTISPECIES: hypothetical protein [Bacillus]KXX88340.1 hypothetical protein AT274_09655 [Bacillus cereus]MCG3790966.1 hypothetical protein [Bacillus sp. UTDS19-33BHI26]RSC62955.1 hypothetical protein EGS86_13780 [Bacillus sp. (in: firmicutes)]HDX9541503.1 hypothetical protein [Bacillus thuringiensis]